MQRTFIPYLFIVPILFFSLYSISLSQGNGEVCAEEEVLVFDETADEFKCELVSKLAIYESYTDETNNTPDTNGCSSGEVLTTKQIGTSNSYYLTCVEDQEGTASDTSNFLRRPSANCNASQVLTYLSGRLTCTNVDITETDITLNCPAGQVLQRVSNNIPNCVASASLTSCSTNEYLFGFESDGGVRCRADQTGGITDAQFNAKLRTQLGNTSRSCSTEGQFLKGYTKTLTAICASPSVDLSGYVSKANLAGLSCTEGQALSTITNSATGTLSKTCVEVSSGTTVDVVGSIGGEVAGEGNVCGDGEYLTGYTYDSTVTDAAGKIVPRCSFIPFIPSSSPEVIGSTPATMERATDVYIQGNYAYVTARNSDKLHIVDISNKTSPRIVGSTPATIDGASVVYVQGNYAYVGASFKVHIVDISNKTSPSRVGSTRNISAGLFNISDIHVQGNYAYIADGSNNSLKIIDVSNKRSPSLVKTVNNIENSRGVYIQGNYAYVTARNSDKLHIVDISNTTSSTIVGSTPATIDGAVGVYIQGNYAYVTGNNSDKLHIVDISNKTSPRIVGSTPATIDGAIGVYIQGNYAYVTAEDSDELYIVDISNKTSPRIVGSTPATIDGAIGVYIQGNYAYVTGNNSDKLHIVDIKEYETSKQIYKHSGSGREATTRIDGMQFSLREPVDNFEVINIYYKCEFAGNRNGGIGYMLQGIPVSVIPSSRNERVYIAGDETDGDAPGYCTMNIWKDGNNIRLQRQNEGGYRTYVYQIWGVR